MGKVYIYVLMILSPLVLLSCGFYSTGSEPATYQLTISASPGEGGSVTPEGGDYEEGQLVDIAATPTGRWAFDGWTGDYEGTGPLATITMNADKNIKATFSRIDPNKTIYALIVNIEGNGSVAKSPDVATYIEGTQVDLTATPDNVWEFVEWQGDLSGQEASETIIMDADKTVTAKFSEIERKDELFSLAPNGVTIKCTDAEVGDIGIVDGVIYTKRAAANITPSNAETTCTSGIPSLGGRFKDRSNFNEDISHWDVSSVTGMNSMFDGASSFNGDLSHWDVSNVENMSRMFANATSFNGDIGDWNVSNVTNMFQMLYNAASFDQDLSRWCVENFSSRPPGFANGSTSLSPEHRPNWGEACTAE